MPDPESFDFNDHAEIAAQKRVKNLTHLDVGSFPECKGCQMMECEYCVVPDKYKVKL